MSARLAVPGDRATERLFFLGMAFALAASVFLGFSRSFFLRPWFPEQRSLIPPEPIFTLHGVVFTLWFVLLLLQPLLVARRRVDLHRRLGWVGAALAALMILLGVAGALVAARRPGGFLGVPVPAASFLLTPLVDLALFGLFVGLAISGRHDSPAHKRWMLLASISILTAAIARWPFAFLKGPVEIFAVTDLFLVPLLAWDLLTRYRPHRATLLGAAILVASQPLRLMVSGSPVWIRFAEWLIG